MKRINGFRVVISLVVLLAASLACDVPGTTSKVAGNLGATETMQALATSVAGTLEPASMGEEVSPESAPPGPSENESAGSSPSPTVSATPTLGAPLVSVGLDTNCRFGPGEVYEYLGALLVGEEAPVVGKLADESFWYIENPDAPPPYCWIWGMYASVSGDKSGIPILTPPPTPTETATPTATQVPLSFAAAEYTILHCNDHAFVTKVTNTGSVTIQSYSITIVHPNDGITLVNVQDFFANEPICGYTYTYSIPAGSFEFIVLEGFQIPGGLYQVTLKVCSEDGLGGICKVLYFEATVI
ncbi:MAG: hypothetical protein P8Z34_08095 [Anaerolineales bacterium]|jgi:hypothetical protein